MVLMVMLSLMPVLDGLGRGITKATDVMLQVPQDGRERARTGKEIQNATDLVQQAKV